MLWMTSMSPTNSSLWSNKRREPTMIKLDRVLVNAD